MAQTLLQSVSATFGWAGLQDLLQDWEISTGPTLSVSGSILPLVCLPHGGNQFFDFGSVAYSRGGWRMRIKTGPTGVANLIAVTPNPPTNPTPSTTPLFDTRGPNPNTITWPSIVLRVSLDSSFVPARSVIADQFWLSTQPGEQNIGPRYFSVDPMIFRFARIENNGAQLSANLVFDAEVVAVP